ncbi:putative clathrin assembly protein At5g57200 isoform X2 [Capsicum annuum]|uniref:putative clathrin assembly protein At5g57200 isoform X2 n=1 Tax=Capsicum annuum TaxID=4072 RepID=UPI0007BEE8BB|nr:putative clathrin assembly protein At5g57200 isoform X2 [Capsicum annuum]
MEKLRKAYAKLKDSTKVGLANVKSEFKDLDIAIVKATNHVESPPKERHIAKILVATSITSPRADVAYCIHALSRRLSKTRNWIVVIKTLIVIHRVLREGDPSSKEELLHYSQRGQIFQLSNFKDDSNHLAWDCSAWVRTYALFLEEKLECFRTLKNDIESDRLSRTSAGISTVHCRTRLLNGKELSEQLPALQQLLYRLTGCQVLRESFKIYCAINDVIISLVDFFFEMSKHDAIKALSIYKRAGQQAEHLAHFYDLCRGLDVARTFQFPTLKQPPASFLETMEEYIREAPQMGSMPNNRLEYQETKQKPEKLEEPFPKLSENKVEEAKNSIEKQAEAQEEALPKKEETPPLISREEPADLLGLNQLDPKVAELEERNALALAIIPPGKENPSANNRAIDTGKTSGWELALLTAPSNNRSKIISDKELAGGFDKLLLDSLYEDDSARRQIQLQQAGYSARYGYEMLGQSSVNHDDPFAMSNHIAPQTSIHMMMAQQQQQQMMQQQPMKQQQHVMLQQQRPQQNMLMVHQQYQGQYSQQTWYIGSSNPFGDPFGYPQSAMPPRGNRPLI